MSRGTFDSDLGIYVKEYVIVFHHYWMGHRKWEKHTINRKNKQEAEEYAQAFCYRKTTSFNHCDYFIVDSK